MADTSCPGYVDHTWISGDGTPEGEDGVPPLQAEDDRLSSGTVVQETE